MGTDAADVVRLISAFHDGPSGLVQRAAGD
jgi:hypothetical protein